MKKEEAKKRIKNLREVINHHRYLYHVKDRQEISDEALDSLKRELKELEDSFPDLKTKDSPTQRVGGEPLDFFKKANHTTPMLSMEDIFTPEDLKNWESYVLRILKKSSVEYFCEVKVDGLALAVIYKDGVLQQALTRGNGRVGEDVTQNAKTIESIPLRLELFQNIKNKTLKNKTENGNFEVRGEVYIPTKEFEKFNRKREKMGEEKYANPRNLAAGSVRQLDPSLAASRPLYFLAYDIITDIGAETHEKEHEALDALGFQTDKTARRCKNTSEVVGYWKEIQKKREKMPYQIDGVVVSVNINNLFQELGTIGKSPRGLRAFKFEAKQATTKVEDIKVHVGRTGAVTPLAILTPVNIGGVTVSRASLHNPDEIERLGVRVGDTVIVERAGDVIPHIVEVVEKMRPENTRAFNVPKKCPQCKTELVKKEGEAILRCPNKKCDSRQREHLNYFVSRSAFDIDGLGPQIIEKLIDEELISDAADIFTLKKGDLEQLEGFGEKSAENIIQSIEASKKIPLSRFINSLNIRYVGTETAIDLAQEFGSIEKLKEASIEKLRSIEGIGEVVAEEVYKWFSEKENIAFVKNLLRAGVDAVPPKRTGSKLKNKTFVFTGSLEGVARPEAEKMVRDLGGSPASSVSASTDFVVAGKDAGTKLDNAKKLGVKILTEEEFLKMIK